SGTVGPVYSEPALRRGGHRLPAGQAPVLRGFLELPAGLPFHRRHLGGAGGDAYLPPGAGGDGPGAGHPGPADRDLHPADHQPPEPDRHQGQPDRPGGPGANGAGVRLPPGPGHGRRHL
ncbi:DUF3795 domain-containing protein, partial [Dysosmobacter welbionis]